MKYKIICPHKALLCRVGHFECQKDAGGHFFVTSDKKVVDFLDQNFPGKFPVEEIPDVGKEKPAKPKVARKRPAKPKAAKKEPQKKKPEPAPVVKKEVK